MSALGYTAGMTPPPPPPSCRAPLLTALVVTVFAALVLAPALARDVVTTSDEARFGVLARDVVVRGAWFGAHARDEAYRNKPPLYVWAVAAAARALGGVSDVAARLPVVAAALMIVFVTVLLGAALFGRRAGWHAGLVLATSWGFVRHAHFVLPDMLVLAFTTVAVHRFWRGVVGPAPRRDRTLFWAAVGFAVFAKGPAGLLPVLAVGVWLWTEDGAAALAWLASPAGLALFGVITLAWVVPFLRLGAGTFGETVLWQDWIAWFVGVPNPLRSLDVLADALQGLLPWSLLLPLIVARGRGLWRDPAARFAFLTALVPLATAMIAANPRERYTLPMYPGAALLVAWATTAPTKDDARGLGRGLGWLALAGGVAAAVLVLLPAGRAVVDLAGVPLARAVPLAAALVVVGGVFFVGLRDGRRAWLPAVGAAAAGVALLYGGWVDVERAHRQEDFRGLAADVARYVGGDEAGVFGGRYLQLDFYLGTSLARLRTIEDLNEFVLPPARRCVVIDDRGWRNVADNVSPRLRVLETKIVRGRTMRVICDR